MAVRLSVVMIQTPPASAAKQALAEQIVGEVIGLPGLDLTLVGPIRTLAESSTDRLSLEVISGDIAFLDWQPQEQAMAELAAIGFAGCRTPHANDPQPNSNHVMNPQRRIYAFDLGQFTQATDVKQALTQLRDHRQVKTLSIGLGPPSKRTPAVPHGKPTTGLTPQDATSEKTPVNMSTPKPATDRAARPSSPQPTTPANSIDLDHLLDQLDELDP
ncbi:MAG: hypothetical protein AAGG48_03125 [Planctomycetota bacterium]